MKTNFEISAIHSEHQYNSYLEEVDKLMSFDPSPDSEEGLLLETLVILIEDYESKRGWEIPFADNPLEVIKIRMKDLGLNQKDLIPVMGNETEVSRILKGTGQLTYPMIKPLSELLRIPPDLLLTSRPV